MYCFFAGLPSGRCHVCSGPPVKKYVCHRLPPSRLRRGERPGVRLPAEATRGGGGGLARRRRDRDGARRAARGEAGGPLASDMCCFYTCPPGGWRHSHRRQPVNRRRCVCHRLSPSRLSWLRCVASGHGAPPAIRMDFLVHRAAPGRATVHTLELTELGFSLLGCAAKRNSIEANFKVLALTWSKDGHDKILTMFRSLTCKRPVDS